MISPSIFLGHRDDGGSDGAIGSDRPNHRLRSHNAVASIERFVRAGLRAACLVARLIKAFAATVHIAALAVSDTDPGGKQIDIRCGGAIKEGEKMLTVG